MCRGYTKNKIPALFLTIYETDNRFIMYTDIVRVLVWLRRIRHCRGFGVQSPSDYRFVRYVINERYPYYAYADLEAEVPGGDRKTRRLCRLYFRLANYRQPAVIADLQPSVPVYARYMQAGCRRAVVGQQLPAGDVAGMVRLPVTADCSQLFEQVAASADEKTLLVLEGIYRDKQAKAFWRSVQRDERVGVTFDLYDAGIVFFDKKRYKHNYLINF
jgi:hypothetical protein